MYKVKCIVSDIYVSVCALCGPIPQNFSTLNGNVDAWQCTKPSTDFLHLLRVCIFCCMWINSIYKCAYHRTNFGVHINYTNTNSFCRPFLVRRHSSESPAGVTGQTCALCIRWFWVIALVNMSWAISQNFMWTPNKNEQSQNGAEARKKNTLKR